ncbi:MAG TPA: hypothetical protein VJ694_01775, partial [Patescibacteria group bacterium]|nr:hypothetical protein [Patescibacteria group bacterium]
MSRTNQKPSTKIEDVLVPRQFDLRLWDTWEAPSLILLLDHKERRILRETFDIHWEDLDIHIRLVDECCGTGVAREQRVRRDKNVKLVYELNKVPDGIQVLLYIQAMTVGIEKPLLDENGYPRKLTFERLFPVNRIDELFFKAWAFMKGMEAFRIAYQAKLDGNEKVFAQLGNAIDFARDGLNGADTAGLTATVEEVVSHDAKKPKGEKKAKPRAVKIETASTEAAPVEASDDV